MADGSIAVLDPILRKIIRMDAGGRFLDEFPLLSGPDADLPDWWLLLRGSDIIGVPAPRLVEADGIPAVVMSLLRFGSYGARVDTILSSTVEAPPGTISSPSPPPGMQLPVAAVLPGGLLAVAGDIPEFRIRVLTPQGEVVRVTCRVPSAAERSDGGRRLAPIGRLFSDSDGRVWAQRGGVAGMLVQDRWFGPPRATFDLFDVDGDYLGHVRAPKDTRLAAAHRGVVMGFRADSDGAVSVVSFRLEAPSAAGETPAN